MPVPAALLPFLVKAIPTILRTFQSLRARHADATDEQVFAMVADQIKRGLAKGEAWLDAHPED